ncbi:hypothetical protein [Pseudomonas putida]
MQRIFKSRRVEGLVLGLVVSGFAHLANAGYATDDPRPDSKDFAVKATSEPVDEVDPYTGDLIIHHKDLTLKGNGGLDIEVWRRYDMAAASGGLRSTHNQSYRWTALGPGWTLGVAPRISSPNFYIANQGALGPVTYQTPSLALLCSGTVLGHTTLTMSLTLQMPDGTSQEIIGDAPYHGVTANNWRVQCISNNVTATSPLGVTYDFGAYADRKIGVYAVSTNDNHSVLTSSSGYPTLATFPSLTENYLDPKTATDLSGNTLTYTYKQFGTAIPSWAPGASKGPLSLLPTDVTKIESPSSLLSSVTSSDGRVVNFQYDSTSGRLSSMTDALGHVWTYTYLAPDSNNSRVLSSVKLPTGDVWSYGYTAGAYNPNIEYGNSTDVTANARKLATLTYPAGGVVSYHYGYYDLRSTIGEINNGNGSYTYTYVSGERVSKRSLSTGESWSYAYTRGSVGVYDATVVTGPDGDTTYRYLGAAYAAQTDLGTSYQNVGWEIGSLMSKTHPGGGSEVYEWQPRLVSSAGYQLLDLGFIRDSASWIPVMKSRVITQDGGTYKTELSNFDAYGNPGVRIETGPLGDIRTTNYSYSNDADKWLIGLVTSIVSDGANVQKTYDATGRVVTVSNDGVSTSFTYDGQGNVVTKTSPRGFVTTYSNYKAGVPQNEVQPEGVSISRVVDDVGNITSKIDGQGNATLQSYDGVGRVVSSTPAIGNVSTTMYVPTGNTVTRGDLVQITQLSPFGEDASVSLGGIAKTYRYDGYGRKVFESNPASPLGTTYTYDDLGRIIKTVYADGAVESTSFGLSNKTVTDARGNATTYSYRSYGDPSEQFLMSVSSPDTASSVSISRNARGQVSQITQNGVVRSYVYDSRHYLVSATNPENGTTVYGRDAEGNNTSKANNGQAAAVYTYDGLNRIVSADYGGGAPNVTNTYDKNNKLLSSVSSTGERHFAYDAAGNLVADTLIVDGKSFALGYAYNANGQLSSTTYPVSGHVVSYVPDVLGRPTEVSGYIDSISYWPSGQIERLSYHNGVVSEYGQNARLWPSSFNVSTPTATLDLNSYSYDLNGNLLSISNTVNSRYNRVFGYDSLNRLIRADGEWGVGAIAYDGADNIVSQVFGEDALSYVYDASNHLSVISGAKNSSLSYNSSGEIVSALDSSYSYDLAGNLICVNCTIPQASVSYSYDALNHRDSVLKVGEDKLYEMYDFSGKLVLQQTAASSPVLTEYIYLGDKRVAQRVNP